MQSFVQNSIPRLGGRVNHIDWRQRHRRFRQLATLAVPANHTPNVIRLPGSK